MDFNLNNFVTPGIWVGVIVAILIVLRMANIFQIGRAHV